MDVVKGCFQLFQVKNELLISSLHLNVLSLYEQQCMHVVCVCVHTVGVCLSTVGTVTGLAFSPSSVCASLSV